MSEKVKLPLIIAFVVLAVLVAGVLGWQSLAPSTPNVSREEAETMTNRQMEMMKAAITGQNPAQQAPAAPAPGEPAPK